MNRFRESGRYERSRLNKYHRCQGFSRNKSRYRPYSNREETRGKEIQPSTVPGNESGFQRNRISRDVNDRSAQIVFRVTRGRIQHGVKTGRPVSPERSTAGEVSCEGDIFYQRHKPGSKTRGSKNESESMRRGKSQERGPSYHRHGSGRYSTCKTPRNQSGGGSGRMPPYIGHSYQRHEVEHDRKVELKDCKSKHQGSQSKFGSREEQMKEKNRWIVTPYKNSREENDDLAAMVFTVLLDNGGKLKRKELESKLGAEPLTMDFEPKESFLKFLNVYKDIFEIQESLNEEKEEGEISDPEVVTKSNIQICIKHASSSQSCKGDCDSLHVCKFNFIGECSFDNCKFGHDLNTGHNKQALRHHYLQHLNPEQVKGLLTDLNYRKGVTIPSICSFYNYIQGCNKPKDCPHLHLCSFIAGKCAFYPNCKRSHDLDDEQPKQVLSKYGIEITPENKDTVIGLLNRGLASKGQGQGKIGSTSPNGSDVEDTKDERKASVLEPRSELCEKLFRYWNSARLGNTESTKS